MTAVEKLVDWPRWVTPHKSWVHKTGDVVGVHGYPVGLTAAVYRDGSVGILAHDEDEVALLEAPYVAPPKPSAADLEAANTTRREAERKALGERHSSEMDALLTKHGNELSAFDAYEAGIAKEFATQTSKEVAGLDSRGDP